MSEHPDLYFDETHLEHPVECREVFLSVIHDTQLIRYTPHAKLKEAEAIIDHLIMDQSVCLCCGCELWNDEMWNDEHHKIDCELAPYMRKRSINHE